MIRIMRNCHRVALRLAFVAAGKATAALLLSLLGASLFSGCTHGPTRDSSPRDGAGAPVSDQHANQAKTRVKTDEIDARDLPPEARLTLQLIKSRGPFPYPKDGAVFGNREMLLPGNPRGYYHEYTVKTPEAKDRGARRIIAGNSGEYYYTNDHYHSFKRIRE